MRPLWARKVQNGLGLACRLLHLTRGVAVVVDCTRLQLATANNVAESKSTSDGAISQGLLIMIIL
jgi:hypothetical protein